MSKTDNASPPSAIWPLSKWHLLLSKPDYVPSTHRYRKISHEEFRLFSRFLDTYREFGKIIVVKALDTVIIPRITGLPVEQDGWRDESKFLRSRVPLGLGEDDFVLVIYGKVSGMYIHVLYARADDAKFRDWVETGIIEPKRYAGFGGSFPATQFLLLAEIIGKNAARVVQAKQLLFTLHDTVQTRGSREHIQNLINGLEREIEHDLVESQITISEVDALIVKVEAGIRLLHDLKEKTSLRFEIESKLEPPKKHDTFGSATILKGQVASLVENLKQHKAALDNLKVMRGYLTQMETASATEPSDLPAGEGAPFG